jgi:hypothetical protein
METAEDVFEESFDKMETTNLEANWRKSEALPEHQEVPTDEAAVETIGVPEGRYKEKRLAVRCR